MSDILDTILLLALPASGKSETRTYMASLSAEQCEKDMHMGATLQLDDYPYVHMMHRFDDELKARGQDYIFYKGPNRPFANPYCWGVLIELLNEDYHNLLNKITHHPESAADHLMDRMDAAMVKVGMEPALGNIPHRIRKEVCAACEADARKELDILNNTCSQDRKGKTIVIELARGGQNGAAFPLCPPRGYQYSLELFSEEILNKATILYVKVTPAESRRKNIERGLPNAQGSILNHSVPMEVMLEEYGCDDMEYMIGESDKPNTIRIDKLINDGKRFEMKHHYIPVGVFDNTADLTTFVRSGKENWKKEDVEKIHKGLADALAILAERSKERK